MKRLLLTAFAVFCCSVYIPAAGLKGIRIENRSFPIIVSVDGTQVCSPTNSCFIANLRPGHYRIEVYREDSYRNGASFPEYSVFLLLS